MAILSSPIIKQATLAGLFLFASHSAFALSPQIVAHRAGTADAPENTIYAIDLAKKNKADAIWITVQLSQDNQLVLYRPSELQALTDKTGTVSAYTAKQLNQVNAAYQYNQKNNLQLPAPKTTIPTLETVLTSYPDTQFYVDLKSPDADPHVQAKALSDLLKKHKALGRVRAYSTNDDFIKALNQSTPEVATFESRDETRTILANSVMSHQCSAPAQMPQATNDKSKRWYGFELHRKVEVVEKYTLGEARSPATLSWDKAAIDCFKRDGEAYIVLFGVNNQSDYQLAKEIGADAVMVDSPKLFKK